VFIELPKFDKPAEKCRTFRDKVIFLFKNLHILSDRPGNFKEKLFDRIFFIAEISKLTSKELKAFRYSMRYNIDERQLAIDCAVEEATEDALAIGYKQGKLDDAKAMLLEGLNPTLVARVTKLPIKQIKAISSV